jgi:hypothetical protein
MQLQLNQLRFEQDKHYLKEKSCTIRSIVFTDFKVVLAVEIVSASIAFFDFADILCLEILKPKGLHLKNFVHLTLFNLFIFIFFFLICNKINFSARSSNR